MSGFERSQSVVSIPSGAPFLPTLVDALISGRLIEGFKPGHDPLALADATIWVPTRRAVRALATEFVHRLDGQAALLPSIRALGDVDEDDMFFDAPDTPLMEQEAIGGLERQTVLAQMIAKWTSELNKEQRALFEGREILMPASFADAAWFAQDLARLMDMVATEEVDWALLETLVPDEGNYTDWWKLTLQFLQIATKAWPHYLKVSNRVDGASLRALALRNQAQIYRNKSAPGPVIAAGSTGSIPATADLLHTIAHMKGGIVVLPGLDRVMDDATWSKVDLPDNDRDDTGTAPGHPQYGLKRLIEHLGVARGDVFNIGGVDDRSAGYARIREEIVSTALLPSDATGLWKDLQTNFNDEQRNRACAGIALVEAAGEREEALAISLSLRETLDHPQHTAALITPDRNLARRVAVELRRFGLDVDDSAGQPLRNRSHGAFVRLILQVAFGQPDPIALVSLIKHPLALFGESPGRARNAAQMLELAIIRGAVTPPTPSTLFDRAQKIHTLREKEEKPDDEDRAPWPTKRFDAQDWEDVFWLAQTIDTLFAPRETIALQDHALRTVALVEACGIDETGGLERLYKNEEGEALYGFLTNLSEQMNDMPLEAAQWPDVFEAYLAGSAVRPNGGTHPRVSILGPLEARLQTYDRVVLGGLNEGTWPAASRNDPFLSRPMKAKLGLPPPERRTGLAAHDIQMLLGMEDVVITRSIRVDNAPAIASRWLQRLLIVAGEKSADSMRAKGQPYLDWALAMDEPDHQPTPAKRPAPCPPLAKRPRRMSVTEVETWVNDPYAIYAKKILKLQPLDSLVREADAREKGILYHGILEDFGRKSAAQTNVEAIKETLSALADARFASSIVPIDIAALWRPRFDMIAEDFAGLHSAHAEKVDEFLIEQSGKVDVEDKNFTLSGRADRVDILHDGAAVIVDYKTSDKPSVKNARELYSPQLPLEAAMVLRGAFKEADKRPASSLIYARLRPDGVKFDHVENKENSASELGEAAWAQLGGLIDLFDNPHHPYVSKARQDTSLFESPYDHLARVREWSYGGGEGEE